MKLPIPYMALMGTELIDEMRQLSILFQTKAFMQRRYSLLDIHLPQPVCYGC